MSALFADGSLAKTAEQAATLIGCSENLLRNAVTERRIPHRRLTSQRGVVFTREDLESFLDQCLVEPTEPTAANGAMAIAPANKRRTRA